MPTSTRSTRKAAPAARKSRDDFDEASGRGIEDPKDRALAAAVEAEEDLFPDDTGQADVQAEDDELDSMLDDEDDLLDDIDEDDSEGWVPDEVGEGIQGVVIKVGETRSDFSDEPAPTVTIRTKSGEKFRIIGFGAVLKREIQDADPQIGDTFAAKYFGEKPVKNGKWAGRNYRHFGVAVRKPKAE